MSKIEMEVLDLLKKSVMEPVTPLLGFVKEKFPHLGKRIDELYQNDKDFQALCGDYISCLQALNRFQKLTSEGHLAVDDYSKLRGDLESELERFLFPEKT
jgi:hypothetical protein